MKCTNQCWWWELVECFRKYFLVSVAIFTFEGYPTSQIVCAIAVCAFFLSLLSIASPYVDPVDDIEAYFGFASLFCIFLFGLCIHVGNVMETYQNIVGDSTKEVWGLEILTWFACFLVLFVVVEGGISFIIAIYLLDDAENTESDSDGSFAEYVRDKQDGDENVNENMSGNVLSNNEDLVDDADAWMIQNAMDDAKKQMETQTLADCDDDYEKVQMDDDAELIVIKTPAVIETPYDRDTELKEREAKVQSRPVE